jgi:hypothetical protein
MSASRLRAISRSTVGSFGAPASRLISTFALMIDGLKLMLHQLLEWTSSSCQVNPVENMLAVVKPPVEDIHQAPANAIMPVLASIDIGMINILIDTKKSSPVMQ